MKRRAVVAALAVLAARPAGAEQSDRVRRIGVLSSFGPTDRVCYAPMVDAMRERNWVEGRKLAFEYRFGDGDPEAIARHAAELVRIPVDLIIAIATPAAHAAKAASRTIPIVFSSADPLNSGLVTNLARPGGNLTGVSTIATDLSGKQLELLRDVIPGARRVAFLGSSRDQNTGGFRREYETAAARLGMALQVELVSGPDGFEAALAAAAAGHAAAVVVQPIFVSACARIAPRAARLGLPWIGDNEQFAAAGALLAFGADRVELWRRTGAQVARVLDGTAPGEMPVEQPTRFNLVVNLASARALRLTIPPAVLLRADEVIE